MKRNLLLAAMLVVSLAVCGSSYAQGTAYFWAGGSFEGEVWHDTVVVTPDQWVEIPIYFMGDPDVYVESLNYPLGCKQALLDTIDVNGGQLFWPLSDWSNKGFFCYTYDDTPPPGFSNPPGYISYAFQGFARYIDPEAPLLHYEIPTKIMSFNLHAANDDGLIGNTYCDAMIAGMSLVGGWPCCGDTTGTITYSMDQSFACVRFIEGYKYLPGDASMAVSAWPPQAIGGDVTYLLNFFRGAPASLPCLFDGFWASADMNGDCIIIGSDVSYRVNVARGIGRIKYCQDYPPAWFSVSDLPEVPPPGWPPCE